MPLKTNVGLTKKLGLPNFGSVGATCHVEFELDQTLSQQDLAAFHQQVQDAFAACRQAVEDELARHQHGSPVPGQSGRTTPPTHGNGQPHRSSNNHPPTPASGASGASDKQLVYLRRLATQIPDVGLQRLDEVAEIVCGKPLVALSTADASHLIDGLKALKSGAQNLNDFLTGTQA